MMSGADRSVAARLFRGAAACVEPFYRLAAGMRNRRYDAGRGVHRAHCPVISVGNLTTGGTGKTPMVLDLVERLTRAGRAPAIVLRGYMADARAGSDEAAVYAARLPDVPVVVNPDRVAAAAQVQRDHPGVDVIVLDDGFQHRRLGRDLDLVLIDATAAWGFGHVLPRGMLREPPHALARADAVIVTHAEGLDAPGRATLGRQIARWHGAEPIAWTRHAWDRLVDAAGEPVSPGPATRVLAFCGIGNPDAFVAEAARRCDVIDTVVFDDHQAYDEAAMARLRRAAEQARPDALLTTEKDWVKLRAVSDRQAPPQPIWRPVLGLDYLAGEDAVSRRLAGIRHG